MRWDSLHENKCYVGYACASEMYKMYETPLYSSEGIYWGSIENLTHPQQRTYCYSLSTLCDTMPRRGTWLWWTTENDVGQSIARARTFQRLILSSSNDALLRQRVSLYTIYNIHYYSTTSPLEDNKHNRYQTFEKQKKKKKHFNREFPSVAELKYLQLTHWHTPFVARHIILCIIIILYINGGRRWSSDQQQRKPKPTYAISSFSFSFIFLLRLLDSKSPIRNNQSHT